MNLDDLTLGQVKQLQSMVGGAVPQSNDAHWEIGKIYLIRTVTMDVSSNGCFLFSSARFQLGGRVWLRIIDLYEKTPISGIVRHKLKWGEAMVVPGIGIEFETITESQRQSLLSPANNLPPEPFSGYDLRKGAK
jgi:hypothetical protein